MEKLSKEIAVNRFIFNILNNESENIINFNKDLVIKALRLFNDDEFWHFYNLYEEYREKPDNFKEKFIQLQFTDCAKYGLEYLHIEEDINQLEEITKIIQTSLEFEKSNKDKSLATLKRLKKYCTDLIKKK